MPTYVIGLVHNRPGTPTMDRNWSRALVVRHAHERRWRLVDILELTDLDTAQQAVAPYLDALPGHPLPPGVLLTHGIPDEHARRLAQHHQLLHDQVAYRDRQDALTDSGA
ncbi:MAG: hypothetical protein H0X35_00470 [Pseudonocardiales bacterium]|nr:hypothetical protein [Pseudonocardiales bacterium]